jgi:protein ImuA
MSLVPSARPAGRDPARLAKLRSAIRAIEAPASGRADPLTVPLGAAAIDAALPWDGLPLGGLHEVAGDAAATGFCAALLARIAGLRPGAPILWCQRGQDLYGHGLGAFGLAAGRLILLHGRNDEEILWAMEEGLRGTAPAAVLGQVHKLSPIAARRLHLAAEKAGTTGLLLRPARPHAPSSAALTRWRVECAPSAPSGASLGAARWRVGLRRCRPGGALARGGTLTTADGFMSPRSWLVEWCDETGDLSVLADIGDRPAEPALAAEPASARQAAS